MKRSEKIVKVIEEKLLAMSPEEREKYLDDIGFKYEKPKPIKSAVCDKQMEAL